MKTAESIILYNFNEKDRLRKIKAILVQMGIRIKTANHGDLNESVGFLFGMKGCVSTKNEDMNDTESLSDELIIFRGFTNQRLNFFLTQIKKNGIPKIPYKAILTPTNENWTLKQLYIEIHLEHEKMSESPTETVHH